MSSRSEANESAERAREQSERSESGSSEKSTIVKLQIEVNPNSNLEFGRILWIFSSSFV